MYKVIVSIRASKEIETLKKSEPVAYKKALSLLDELYTHPYTGTGQPKKLRSNLSGYYSRRISQKHRLVYQIVDDIITVFVASAYGHYDDK